MVLDAKRRTEWASKSRRPSVTPSKLLGAASPSTAETPAIVQEQTRSPGLSSAIAAPCKCLLARPAAPARAAGAQRSTTAHTARARRAVCLTRIERARRRPRARSPATRRATGPPSAPATLTITPPRALLRSSPPLPVEDSLQLIDLRRRQIAFLEERDHRRQQGAIEHAREESP